MIGNTAGDPGQSLKIELEKPKAGLWLDFATGESGDLVTLISQKENLSFPQAVESTERAFGVSLHLDSLPARNQSMGTSRTNLRRSLPPQQSVIPPWGGFYYHISSEESRRVYEATKALGGSPERIAQISNWRGLKPETIRSLVLDSALGIEGNSLTFPFETGMKLRPIGGGSHQSWWAFGKPFLWRGWPLVDRSFSDCVQTVHVCEGEFDCARLLELEFETEDLSEICIAVPGCNCFKPEWANLFRAKTVYLWLDDDPAGRQATKRIGSLLTQVEAQVRVGDLSGLKEAV